MIRSIALAILLCAMGTNVARADKWPTAETKTYASPDGTRRLTVHPRDLSSIPDYFKDQVAGRAQPGGIPGSEQTSAQGHMERHADGQWHTEWEKPLANDVAPVSVLVADDGHVVTFDNWHSTGYGPDAVVIYDARGVLVRALSLLDFLPSDYFRALPRSVSSIEWRGTPRISQDATQVIIPVIVPTADEEQAPEEEDYVDVRIALATGQPIADGGPAWKQAVESAHQAFEQIQAQQRAEEARFIAPLSAPATIDESDWHGYLVEAYFRLAGAGGYPSTQVIRLPDREDFEKSVGFLREVLASEPYQRDVIMITSPSQEALVRVLTQEAARVTPNALAGTRIYVAADQHHLPAAREALAPTGATFIPIDIAQPIPQRQDRLEDYLKNREEAEREAAAES